MPERRLGLPLKPFFYTLDQIAYLLEVEERYLKGSLIHFEGRSVGVCPRDRMKAVDISPDDAKRPDWRVDEKTFIRWLRFKGYRYHERGYIS